MRNLRGGGGGGKQQWWTNFLGQLTQFSLFPPRPQAVLWFVHPRTLYPVLKVFVHPNIV